MRKKIELLAPAQNLTIGTAAINYGADAVYIGASAFGARKNAANKLEDIEKLINYAHKFGVRIYVTVNTILTDDELKGAQKLIWALYDMGADAVIFQDMGLLEIELPPIELHASTQCDIRTVDKVKFFEQIGIKRVILARELSLNKIKEIALNTNIELECFIHGALCVCYSGQCYMSAYMGGRSANRGECAQACRKKYSLMNDSCKYIAKDKYLLSMKDLCAEKYLDELISSGVSSFKIEGRLKDEFYIKNTVLYYNNLLSKYERTSCGKVFADFEPDINKTFNRGFTTYFLGEENTVFNFDTPKATGEFLGKVSKVYSDCFEIETGEKIMAQDGLCFMSNGELKGFLVNKNENGKIYPNKRIDIKTGCKIFRNQNAAFEKNVKNSKTKRLKGAVIEIYPNKITAKYNNFQAFVPIENMEPAKNPEKMKEIFIKSFQKSGEEIFYAENISFLCKDIPFMPFSVLNSKRRELFQKLEKISVYKKSEFKRRGYAKYISLPNDYRLNIHNKKASEFYKKCGILNQMPSVESSLSFKNKELMRTKYCIRKSLNMCLKSANANKEKLFLIDETGKKFPLKFYCNLCEMAVICP